ncbi:DUF1648 domain-containing protein [Streptomyces sp. NPDC054841]
MWGAVGWTAGTLALLVALPLGASGRLPDRLATHWDGGSGEPDGSMPLWAATFFPALIWAGMVLGVGLAVRRTVAGSGGAPRGWAAVALLSGGVFLTGTQASVVRANMDHTDWHDADPVTLWVVGTGVAAAVAGLAGWLVIRRTPMATTPSVPAGPSMQIPEGERYVWLSRTSNPWLHAASALTGLMAIAVVLAAVGGLMPLQWALVAPFALASLLLLGCASVQARASDKGLEVAFGPLGFPARHWAVEDIASARVENRTPAQVGGWGYRLSGLGTTVMLRSGECLVIRSKGKDFAVSVDDAERGAALLNSLSTRRAG